MSWRVPDVQVEDGEAEIEALVVAGDLQNHSGEAANGERLLRKALTTLERARSAIDTDPDSAFGLAHDATRRAHTALLAHQGRLRPRAATTLSNGVPARISDRASASSVRYVVGATNWSTPNPPR